MSYIHGIDVVLHKKTVSSYDDFGAPVETETDITVKNVLVFPASANDVTDNLNMHGIVVQYNLCIPKGDTNDWRDTTVEFFGEKWRTVGDCKEYIEDLIPLDWNKQIVVTRNEHKSTT